MIRGPRHGLGLGGRALSPADGTLLCEGEFTKVAAECSLGLSCEYATPSALLRPGAVLELRGLAYIPATPRMPVLHQIYSGVRPCASTTPSPVGLRPSRIKFGCSFDDTTARHGALGTYLLRGGQCDRTANEFGAGSGAKALTLNFLSKFIARNVARICAVAEQLGVTDSDHNH